ncbi:MAG: hypothetical protein AB2L24_17275 [Mangrovibacterium sp.]
MIAKNLKSGRIDRLMLCFLLIVLQNTSSAGGKYKLEDFAMSLEKITSAPNHTWVNSGSTTVNPESQTVMGVNDFYSPPLAAIHFNLSVTIHVDGIMIADRLNYGKGDVGLLYSRGTWYPHKIVREGTYHHFKNQKLISFAVVSELIPVFGMCGFVEKITILNRSGRSLPFHLNVAVRPGNPSDIPLNNWGFGKPSPNQHEASELTGNSWGNDAAVIHLEGENNEFSLNANESGTAYYTVIMTNAAVKDLTVPGGDVLIGLSQKAWENRLATFTKNIPVVRSNVEGLDEYYKRSVLTGLVCVWENPAYALNPFPSECGMDGGATCLYPWGMAYVPNMASLMFDQHIITIARKLAEIDLQKYYACTLNGQGAGVKYSYDTYAYAVICDAIFKFFGPHKDLFDEAKRIILNDEQQRQENFLIDYGVQHNLLEMRGAGWEHVVVSPNAERVSCMDILANMGKLLHSDANEIKYWKSQADQITRSIQKNLWDSDEKWFSCIYPDGYRDFVYSIQAFDVLRTGVCTDEMKKAVIAHLKDGAFLAEYGVESISKEDRIHHEVVDSDWSGGGAYTGDGPQVALTMYEQNEPELGWNILKRHFWMGKQLLYYPQEHLVDNPVIPGHKRSTIFAGLIGAEAILFGLTGFQPDYNGQLFIHPRMTVDGNISITGFGYRGDLFDVYFSRDKMKVIRNGKVVYDGKTKKLKIN